MIWVSHILGVIEVGARGPLPPNILHGGGGGHRETYTMQIKCFS